MFLNKSVILSLLFAFFLVGCSGSDDFGLGNGQGNSGGTTTDTDTGGDTEDPDTSTNVDLALGSGSGSSFISGVLTTSIGSDLLSYGGNSTVSVNIVDASDNALYTSASTTVSFTSSCVQNGQSEIDTSVNSSSGVAVATYRAITCEGTDTITASLSDGSSATTIINVAAQVLGALEFVSASPATLALKGSGSSAIPEVSTISFSLKDKTGAAMSGETISYQLSTEVGGISLAQASSVTDSEGLASVKLNAGGVNTSVVVTASVEIENLDGSISTTSTTSKPISILGGIPDQDSFSISVETFNPRGWDVDGTVSKITIRAADRFNNQARDGTQISFVTNGGAVVGACELSGGACSVNWTSQDPKPADGIIRILARTTGEESFVDANSNGIFDVGELVLTDLDEAFLDVNGSGARDADNEFFSDFNNNGVFDTKQNSLFQGAGCSQAAIDAGHCANLVDVRATARLCMSGDELDVSTDVGSLDLTTGQKSVWVTVEDQRGLTPPVGTSINVSVEDAVIVFGGGAVGIPNECSQSGYSFEVIVKAPDAPTKPTGLLKIEVTQPDNVLRRLDVNLKTL